MCKKEINNSVYYSIKEFEEKFFPKDDDKKDIEKEYDPELIGQRYAEETIKEIEEHLNT
jgi:hypothetical protein